MTRVVIGTVLAGLAAGCTWTDTGLGGATAAIVAGNDIPLSTPGLEWLATFGPQGGRCSGVLLDSSHVLTAAR